MTLIQDPIVGDKSLFDAVLRNEFSASMVHTLRSYLSPQQIVRLRSSLSGEALEVFENPPSRLSWIPMEIGIELFRATIIGPWSSKLDEMAAFTGFAADNDTSTILKGLLFFSGHPPLVSKRLHIGFSKYFRPTKVEITETSNGKMTFEAIGDPLPYFFCNYSIGYWPEVALKIAGAVGTRCAHTMCRHRGDPKCEWSVTWEKQ